MKTISKNLKILTLALSLGSLALMGSACSGSGSQGLVEAPSTDQGTIEKETPPVVQQPIVNPSPAPVANLKTCYTYSFVSTREDSAQNVFLADTCNTQAPRKLTANADHQISMNDLAFNSNGTKLAFDHVANTLIRAFPSPTLMTPPSSPSQFATSVEINSADLGGNGSGDFFPHDLAFEPNGGRTAFIAVTPTETQDSSGLNLEVFPTSIKLFDPTSGALRNLVSNTDENIQFHQLSWHPNGEQLFFSESDETTHQTFLSLYDLVSDRQFFLREGNNQITLLHLDGFLPAVRPDGNTLAFVRRNKVDGKDQIFTCTLTSTGGPVRNLCQGITPLTSVGSNSHPRWTPDGQFLLFDSDRDGNREIYQMKADGSEQVRLTQSSSDDLAPAVHPVSFQIPAN